MNGLDQLDPLGEDMLRHALKLEGDERAPRLDPLAIIAAAQYRSPRERVSRAARGLALLGAAAALEMLVALATFTALVDADISVPMGFVLWITASLAEQAVALGSITASPAVGLATLAAVLFATIFERTGREDRRVTTS